MPAPPDPTHCDGASTPSTAWPTPYAAIDWQRPWLQPWRHAGAPLADAAARSGTLHALQQLPDCPVGFVPQAELDAGRAYESFISETGNCPVREGLHDFFNGLCWHVFPQSKRRLNRLQAEAIATQPAAAPRGPLRDAITLFDENGAVLLAPPQVIEPLWQSLRAHDWTTLFVTQRDLWQQADLVLFGHALLEKLVHPRKAITAHVLALPCDEHPLPGDTRRVDARLAARLRPETLAGKPFSPLPVLGVPGWWADNKQNSFYDDASVFRPARRSRP